MWIVFVYCIERFLYFSVLIVITSTNLINYLYMYCIFFWFLFQLRLKCQAEGIPQPKITWKKDGIPIENVQRPHKHRGYIQKVDQWMLKIHGLLKSDEGDYECTVSNSKGSIRWDISIQFIVPNSKFLQNDSFLHLRYKLFLTRVILWQDNGHFCFFRCISRWLKTKYENVSHFFDLFTIWKENWQPELFLNCGNNKKLLLSFGVWY